MVCTATRAAKVDSLHVISCIFDATAILVLLTYTGLVCYLKLHNKVPSKVLQAWAGTEPHALFVCRLSYVFC